MSLTWLVLKEKGNEEYKKKEYSSAITFYTDAIKSDPNQDVLYANRALCYIALKKYYNAITDLNRCININPRNIKALKRLANLQINLGNIGVFMNNQKEAEIFLKSCISLEPNEASHKDELKIVQDLIKDHDELMKSKYNNDYKKSEILSENILRRCNDFTKIKLIYIECLLKNCRINEGILFLKSRVTEEERNKHEEFHYFQALSMYYDGKYEKARQLINALILKTKEKPKYTEFLTKLDAIEHDKDRANDFFKKGEYDNAIFLYEKLIEIDKDNNTFMSTIYANKALCYQRMNRLIDALNDINKSLKYNTNYTKAYLRRGQIQFKLKNYEEALTDFDKVKLIDPSTIYIFIPDNKDIYKLIDETKKEIRKSKRKDYYKILEIYPNATQDQIKKQFKILSKKYHPDKNNGNDDKMRLIEKKFREVNEAYKVLSDPQRKKMYDSGLNPDDVDSRQNFQYEREDSFFTEANADNINENKTEQSQSNFREEHPSKTNKRKSKFDN